MNINNIITDAQIRHKKRYTST